MISERTGLEEHNLVILGEVHEAGNHLGELDDLLHGECQLLCHLSPQLPVALKTHDITDLLSITVKSFTFNGHLSSCISWVEQATN